MIYGADILTMDARLGDYEGGDLLIDGSVIAVVDQLIDFDDAEVVDLRGKILMPGFIDTHSHGWIQSDSGMWPLNCNCMVV